MNLAKLSMQTEEAGFVSLITSMQELEAINFVDNSEMQAATAMANKVSDVCTVVEDALEGSAVLESLKAAIESGDLGDNKHALKAVCIAVEHIKSTLGYTEKSNSLSTESLGDVAKGISDFLATVFKAIFDAVKKLIGFVVRFIKWMFGVRTSTVRKRARYESTWASYNKTHIPTSREIDELTENISAHVYKNIGRIADGSVSVETVLRGAIGHKGVAKDKYVTAVHGSVVGVHICSDRARLGHFESIPKLPEFLKSNMAVFNEIMAGLNEYFKHYNDINDAIMKPSGSSSTLETLLNVTQEDVEANRKHLAENYISLPLIKHPMTNKVLAGESDIQKYQGSSRVMTSKKIFDTTYLRTTYSATGGIGKIGIEIKEEKDVKPMELRYVKYDHKVMLAGLKVLDQYKVGTDENKINMLRKCMSKLESYERFFSSSDNEQSARVRQLVGFMKEALSAYATVLSKGIVPLDHMVTQTSGAVYDLLTNEINLDHFCRLIAIDIAYDSE